MSKKHSVKPMKSEIELNPLRMSCAEWARQLNVERSTLSTWVGKAGCRLNGQKLTLWELLYLLKFGGNSELYVPLDRLLVLNPWQEAGMELPESG